MLTCTSIIAAGSCRDSRARLSLRHSETPALYFILSTQNYVDSLCICEVLLLQNSCRESVFVVGIKHRNRLLHNDGSVIELFVDKMHGAAGDFHSVGEGLLLRFESGNAGSSEGWMLRIRLGNCCTKHGESRRMYPARQTRSTLCCLSAATTSWSCSSRGFPFDGITNAFKPRSRAVAMPGASTLLEITTAMRASAMRPASMLSAIATKFEPRPERECPGCA